MHRGPEPVVRLFLLCYQYAGYILVEQTVSPELVAVDSLQRGKHNTFTLCRAVLRSAVVFCYDRYGSMGPVALE